MHTIRQQVKEITYTHINKKSVKDEGRYERVYWMKNIAANNLDGDMMHADIVRGTLVLLGEITVMEMLTRVPINLNVVDLCRPWVLESDIVLQLVTSGVDLFYEVCWADGPGGLVSIVILRGS